ncbi:uncharacterized protein LOC124171635 [Ischnura elegans]|uniref:uncharacterized protein LOC124171635 n=1 Tax=Ischnura elegans TaxID=197161 RepID=UPI001ED8714B|nr:uncharacterized protein LOC124171635 [Ischnura elegans]
MFWRCAAIISLLALWGAIGLESSYNGADPRKYGSLDIRIDNLGANTPLNWATAGVQCGTGDNKVNMTTKDCKGGPKACFNCTSLLICQNVAGTYHPLFCSTCSTTFCDPTVSRCVDKAPLQCRPHQECTSPGFFPNPLECETYFRCQEEDGDLKLQVLLCPHGQVYKSKANNDTGGCVKRTAPTDCCRTPCNVGDNKFLPFGCDHRFYLYCSGDKATPFIFRCPQGNFNETTLDCN